MQAAHLQDQEQRKRSGIVLLMMLLLVIVLGVMVYFFKMYPQDRETKRIQEQSPDKYPWVEEWRIEHLGRHKPRGHVQQALSDEQPDVTETIQFRAKVWEQGDDRGQILMAIHPDGTVEGGWGADYETISPRVHYSVINAAFKGNTDPSKVYTDEGGIDRSKLYIITKGKYLILETNYETNKVRKIEGNIYVVCWLSPDLSAFGRLHITPDKKTQKIYEWEDVGKRMNLNLLQLKR